MTDTVSMKEILSQVASKLEGIRLLTVMDSDCMVLASWEAPDNKTSPDGLGEFVQQIKNTINSFKQSANGLSRLDDIVLGTSSSYILLKPICSGFCFVVVDAPKNVSLGTIRTTLASFTQKLEQAIPGYEAVVS